MGDVPAGHISKGVIHAKVDALVNHKDAQGKFDKRPAFLAALKTARTSDQYLDMLKTQAGVTVDEADYLNRYFYKPGPDRWWPSLQPIFPRFLKGLIKALEEAGATLLLDSYWAPAAPIEVAEVIVCKTPVQVTRIFLTPPAGAGLMRQRTVRVPIWVVTGKTDPSQQLGFSTTDAVVTDVDGDVVTWQKLEFPNSMTAT